MQKRRSPFFYLNIFFIAELLLIVPAIVFGRMGMKWLLFSLVVYIVVLTLGSIFIRLNFYLHAQHTLRFFQKNVQPTVALTFDDGPAAYTSAVLDILKTEQVPATFFLIGKNIYGNESIVARMHHEGHTIGNHSFHHGFNFDWQSASRMEQEIISTNAAIQQITGQPVKLFRPPYGVTNPNPSRALRKTGLKSIGWSIRSMDTVVQSDLRLIAKIMRSLKDGDIILLHDRCAITAKILPQLIQAIKAKGFRFIAL
jgi:peptidoglycan/xylan/chitin deacetylase (PgdA/CDA1 family)